ncbi:MAG: hypothetical protein ACK5MO_16625, partial [Planctomyces sp.]
MISTWQPSREGEAPAEPHSEGRLVGLGGSLALPRGFAEVRGVERQGRCLACEFGIRECGRAWSV